jgi:hypothetical protein
MNGIDPEYELYDSAESQIVEWQAPYVQFCDDLAALRDVDVSDDVAVAEAIDRLGRMGKAFEDHIGRGWDEDTYLQVLGITSRDVDALLAMFQDALAQLKRVEGVNFMAASASIAACQGLAACMAVLMAQVYG